MVKDKKILIIANNDVGLYQFRKELIFELLKNNKVYIALPYGEQVDYLTEKGCVFIDTPLDRRGMNPIKDLSLAVQYMKICTTVKPNLVITYTVKPNVYGGFAARVMKIPYVVNITGLGTAFQNDGMLKKIITLMYKVGCKKAKTVFFENAENMQIFLDNKIVQEKQTCLLNGAGVNTEHYTVTPYPEGDEIKFLFVGRVMKEKGIDELFSAMKHLVAEGHNCSLDVVGMYEEDYKETIDTYQSEGWLRYHGFQKDVRPFIENCHCFVLPSWHEGMANTNLECATSGRPVITSNIHGCLESVENGVSGLLCKKQDADDLYITLKRFIDLPYEKRKAMGLAGRKRMEAIFDKKKVVEETIEGIGK